MAIFARVATIAATNLEVMAMESIHTKLRDRLVALLAYALTHGLDAKLATLIALAFSVAESFDMLIPALISACASSNKIIKTRVFMLVAASPATSTLTL